MKQNSFTKKSALVMGALLVAGAQTASIRNLQAQDPNCRTFNNDGSCDQCVFRSVKNSSTGLCENVSDQCRTWSSTTGDCTSCYDGYSLSSGECVLGDLPPIGSGDRDPNCQCYDDNRNCIDCFDGFYLNGQGECVEIPDNCVQVNVQTGDCQVCDDGFEVNSDGQCDVPVGDPEDPCIKYKYVYKGKYYHHWFHGCEKVCAECAQGFYLDPNHECQQIPENCAEVNTQTGQCIECNDGFQLNDDGQCVISIGDPNDDNCEKYGYKYKGKWYHHWFHGCEKVCVKCDDGFYLDYHYECQQLPENCAQGDRKGNCIQCNEGFDLNDDGECNIAIGSGSDDPYCIEVDANDVCTKCAFRFILNDDKECEQVSDYCRTWDHDDGHCTSCYDGYKLQGGFCTIL